MAFTSFITQSIGGVVDTRVALSGSGAHAYIVRNHGFGDNWNRLRIGARVIAEKANGATPTAFTYGLGMGVCTDTGSIGSSFVKHAFFGLWVPAAATYNAAAGGSMAYWSFGGNNVSERFINNGGVYSINDTSTVFLPADETSATRRMFFVDIIKNASGTSWGIQMFFPSSATSSPDVLDVDFYNNLPLTQPQFTNHSETSVIGTTRNDPGHVGEPMIVDITSGSLNSAFIYQFCSGYAPRIFLCDWGVVKIS